MLYPADNGISLLGYEINGQVFKTLDETSVYAIYDCDNVSIGVMYETDAPTPFLEFSPAMQIPPYARDDFKEWLFKADGDEWVKSLFDPEDGEIKFKVRIDRDDPALAVEAVETWLDFINDVAYPAIIKYITECRRRSQH